VVLLNFQKSLRLGNVAPDILELNPTFVLLASYFI
jgi:hypothetical protein